MAIRILCNVPAAELDSVDRMFRNTGATNIEHSPEPDGEFTVTAIFPDMERHATLAQRLVDNVDVSANTAAALA